MNFKYSNEVFDLSEKFLKCANYVKINNDKVKKVAAIIPNYEKPNFSFLKNSPDQFKNIVFELVSNSINYCYWYGRHNIRPNGASATMLYLLVEKSFEHFPHQSFDLCIDQLKKYISLSRFPLIEERHKHLDELKLYGEDFCHAVNNDISLTSSFENLIKLFPGYASDLFLKRASLFFCQVYRRTNKFAQDLSFLHIPADYQVPKILKKLNCIKYSKGLREKIENNEHIPKYSPEECEIRAATIIVAKQLCNLTGWNVADIDGWLWLQKDTINSAFHLTVTTDY